MEKISLGDYKKKLLEVMMILLERGVFEYTAGHASVRIPGTDQILVPGHIHPEHRTIDSLIEADLTLIDINGKTLEGKLPPPGEKYIHTEIYKLRPDVGSVIHIHPPIATALGIAGKEVLPISLHSTIFYPKVPIHPFPGQVDTPALGKEFAEMLGKGYAVVQQGHGAITVGTTLERACVAALLLEDTAELQWKAMVAGTPRPLPDKFLQGKQQKFAQGTEDWEFFGNPWDFYYNKYMKKK